MKIRFLILYFLMLIFSGGVFGMDLSALNHPNFRLGTWPGSSFVEVAREKLPNVKIVFFKDSNEDLITALLGGEIDAFMADRISAVDLMKDNVDLQILDMPIDKTYYGMAFNPKNRALRDEFSSEIVKLKQSGFLSKLQQNWFSDNKVNTIAPHGTRGTLRVGTSAVDPPFSFFENNKLVGIEIELVNQIAKNLGYGVEWSVVNHSNFISALLNNQIDISAALITITPERNRQILFSEPDYQDNVVLVVRHDFDINQVL